MNLSQYIVNNPLATLADVQNYSKSILSNTDNLREYLMIKGKWGNVISHTASTTDVLFNAASGIVHKATKEQPISFDPNTTNGAAHLLMLDAFVKFGDINTVDKAEIISFAITKPFKNTTRANFNAAKGIFTAKQIAFVAGKDIVVTLNNTLPEKVAVTTWRVEAGFEDENTGRAVQVQNAQKYRINMQGKKSGNYELRIPLLNVDFSVELA